MADKKRFSEDQIELFAFIRQKLHIEVADEEAANAKVGASHFPKDIAEALGIQHKAHKKTQSERQHFVNELHEMLQIPDLTLKQATTYHMTRWNFRKAIEFPHEFAHLILGLANIPHYQGDWDIELNAALPLDLIIKYSKCNPEVLHQNQEDTFFRNAPQGESAISWQEKEEIFAKIKPFLDVVLEIYKQDPPVDIESIKLRDFVKAVGMEEKLPPLITAGAADKNLSRVPPEKVQERA